MRLGAGFVAGAVGTTMWFWLWPAGTAIGNKPRSAASEPGRLGPADVRAAELAGDTIAAGAAASVSVRARAIAEGGASGAAGARAAERGAGGLTAGGLARAANGAAAAAATPRAASAMSEPARLATGSFVADAGRGAGSGSVAAGGGLGGCTDTATGSSGPGQLAAR